MRRAALLFRALATTELPDILPWGLWLSYYGSMLLAWAIGFALAIMLLGRPLRDSIMIGFGCGQGNTVMLGIPIILTGFGEAAATPLFLLLAFHGLILITSATFLMELTRPVAETEQRQTGPQVLWSGLKSSARNPVLIGLGAGIVYGQTGLAIPAIFDGTLDLLGRSGIPCALFVLGAMLNRYHIRRSIGAATLTTSLKLTLHPLLVWCAATFLFHLPPLWVAVATVLAAMPTGVYSSILANRFQVAPGATSSTVVLATGVSLVTITFILNLLL